MNNSTCKFIIGVCGLNASGKSTVCHFFKDQGYTVLSLSDIIRKTLSDRNIPENRDNLINMGNELRNKSGAGVLAMKTIDILESNKNYVIDSIRHPDEVKAFREMFLGANNNDNRKFYLISITSPPMARFNRIQSRNRIGDKVDYQQFMEIEKKEMNNPDPLGQQVARVMEMSDFVIDNDPMKISSIDQLYKEISTLYHKSINKANSSTSSSSGSPLNSGN
ncbi:hypothetical protein CYY_006910 [Polysphondylium violaceum]|uniref:Dephospho-CoA kinase n=1 Tax=Polysphondylium violaceum TaxID=133409 RepID=A0A8J4PSN3_9MYCE|nr:hypothetical protein CYY_006910 [Polysphondylium violaceum]